MEQVSKKEKAKVAAKRKAQNAQNTGAKETKPKKKKTALKPSTSKKNAAKRVKGKKSKDKGDKKSGNDAGKFVTFSPFLRAALDSPSVMIKVSLALALSCQYIVMAVLALVALPVGARLSSSFARPAWSVVARGNRWLWDTVTRGYAWSWETLPPLQSKIVKSRENLDSDSLVVLDSEVEDAVDAGALFPVPSHVIEQETTVVSGYFAIPKPSSPGQFRPIIDLRFVNKFIVKKKFKMTKYSDVAGHLTSRCFMVTVDLTKAYFAVPIRSKLWRFLRICWRSIYYEFKTLCFGLTSAPRIFTKITRGALFFMRSVWQISILAYIDDFIIFGATEEEACLHRDLFLVLMSLLGFQIREEKSSLVPSHLVKYLGFWWDSENMTVFLPLAKKERIICDVNSFLEAGGLTVKNLERLLGRLESIRFVFPHAPVFYRALQRLLNRYRKKSKLFLALDRNLSAKRDLIWWSSSFSDQHACKSLLVRPVSVVITSDAAGKPSAWDKASKSAEHFPSKFRGYGAYDDKGNFIQHEWTDSELDWHINQQELVGSIAALKTMASPGDHVLLRSDNRTAEAYLRKKGGTRSMKLCKLAVEACRWLMDNNIHLSVQHVSSEENDVADMLSRFHINFWEFSLKEEYFENMVFFFKDLTGISPTCDVFSSRDTARMSNYCSWRRDPLAMGQDAFLVKDWTPFPYLFPPTPLLQRVLREVATRRTRCLLVAPYWPYKEWFPLLQKMKVAALPLPPGHICLVHKVYKQVEAKVNPLYGFLLDGSLLGETSD